MNRIDVPRITVKGTEARQQYHTVAPVTRGCFEELQWREYVPESALGRQHRLWLLALMTWFLVCVEGSTQV